MTNKKPVDFYNDMFVVTGGAGFIGSHVVEQLVEQGTPAEHIYVYDNLSRGSMANLQGILPQRQLKAVNLKYTATFPDKPVIIHLAAKVTGIEYNRQHQFDMLRENMAINTAVYNAAIAANAKAILAVSTACVYPHNAPVPTPEEWGRVCDPEPTNYGYGVAKWVSEQQVRLLGTEYEIPVMVLRFFNAFGQRDYYDYATSHVVPALIRRFYEDDQVVVWGTGEQKRVFVDANDIATCILKLSQNPDAFEVDAINIGHQREISIRELAEKLRDLTGQDKEIIFDTSKPNGYERRAADTRLLKSLISYEPDTPIDLTLERMIQDFQERGFLNGCW